MARRHDTTDFRLLLQTTVTPRGAATIVTTRIAPAHCLPTLLDLHEDTGYCAEDCGECHDGWSALMSRRPRSQRHTVPK